MFRKIIVSFFLIFISVELIAQNSVHLELVSVPSYNTPDADIFIAGSFNGWNPKDNNFKFSKDEKNNYSLNLKLANGSYDYKITRGGWDKVECRESGADIGNRTLKVEGDATVQINVEGWKDHFPSVAVQRKHTAGPTVHIIDTAFLIPQLNRTRRIWVYLPEEYETSTKKYPVLYMHDGQNVFDDATSYAGEWGVDECIDTMKQKSIVVAIDNGLNKRLNEYCPYDFSLTGIGANANSNKGEGDQYVDFLVKTLKPFIDKNYRTLEDKEHTYIAGSSMGGLISMYAVLKYPDVFGGVGVFSPAFWVAPKIFDDIMSKGKVVKGKIYFYCGGQESDRMVPDMQKANDEMKEVSKSKTKSVVNPDGKHNEPNWRAEFPKFYEWIFSKN